ncbi:alpha/beta fold hydrolase [Enterovirga rhinocerotis]|uniref:Pimeloyl-ACP methyl ester carboxylesterase n=1 Tax=Enterovirga rhinocerotis TaxID=1339210 RepID=A0A4R7C8L7_9HYPH|nr:alpha/beta hydrolase [Enterovirga rhinocerotis]TDR94721.1 pimeloyl-ACP methyl ester carboxylesterase [Enterovirga rhinocerotis]
MKRPILVAFAMMASLGAQAAETYGPELDGFEYPHEVKHHRFTSQRQDVSMAYMDVRPEKANGRTIVLLHGKNFCAATWEGTIAALTKVGYRVIAPDQVGFCKSTKPAGYQFSFQQLATNTAGLLSSLGIEKATVLGHSMGGMLATRFALMMPERVEKLVLVAPLGLEDWQAAGVPWLPIEKAYEAERKTTFDSIKAYQLKFYYNGVWRPEYDRWVQMQAGLYAGPGAERVAWNSAQTGDMIFTQPVLHELPALRVPTVLIIGGKDRTAPGANRASKELAGTLGRYDRLGKAAAERIPGASLVEFPEMGHSPQVEAPDRFHEALLRELKKQ